VKDHNAVGDGRVDDTTAIQNAINATSGFGTVYFPKGVYRITASLTIPNYVDGAFVYLAPFRMVGANRHTALIFNQAPASTPSLLIDNQKMITVSNLGFVGDHRYPNIGIKVQNNSSHLRFEGLWNFANGHAWHLEDVHSVWITNCEGLGAAIRPLYPGGDDWSWSGIDWIHVNIPNGGFVNHLVVENNFNEGGEYQIKTEQAGTGIGLNWRVTGNQFESSTNGISLDKVTNLSISDNYLAEAGTGYAVNLTNCTGVHMVSNYIASGGVDALSGAVRLDATVRAFISDEMTRLILVNDCRQIVVSGCKVRRIQDESTTSNLTLVGCVISDKTVASATNTMNSQEGRRTWYAATATSTVYPTAALGDRILKPTPVVNTSLGWICTTAANAGALVQTTGSGPSPTVPTDYQDGTAYDFRITCLVGGVTGTATYKVEWKTAGGGSYAEMVASQATTELVHDVGRDAASGPSGSFGIAWPTGVTYVATDVWTLTAVVAPVWTPLTQLHA
jgi:hypothetical protein